MPTTATGGAEPGPAGQGSGVGGGVDPEGQSGHHHDAGLGQSPAEVRRPPGAPYRVADRVPTTATAGRPSRTDGSPVAHRTAGAPGSPTSAAG